jgi:hypothetical protein
MSKAIAAMPPRAPDPQKVIRRFVSIICKLNIKKLPPARPRPLRKGR